MKTLPSSPESRRFCKGFELANTVYGTAIRFKNKYYLQYFAIPLDNNRNTADLGGNLTLSRGKILSSWDSYASFNLVSKPSNKIWFLLKRTVAMHTFMLFKDTFCSGLATNIVFGSLLSPPNEYENQNRFSWRSSDPPARQESALSCGSRSLLLGSLLRIWDSLVRWGEEELKATLKKDPRLLVEVAVDLFQTSNLFSNPPGSELEF